MFDGQHAAYCNGSVLNVFLECAVGDRNIKTLLTDNGLAFGKPKLLWCRISPQVAESRVVQSLVNTSEVDPL